MPRNDIAGGFQLWYVGGIGGGTFDKIGQIGPFLVVGFLASMISARGLNSLALGDDLAVLDPDVADFAVDVVGGIVDSAVGYFEHLDLEFVSALLLSPV